MHTKLSKAPVTYVLAQVRFSNIQTISEYIPAFQDKIRGLFPYFQEITLQKMQGSQLQQVIATATQQKTLGPQFQQVIAIVTQWHFLDKNKALINQNHETIISNEALAALTLFIATSKSDES